LRSSAKQPGDPQRPSRRDPAANKQRAPYWGRVVCLERRLLAPLVSRHALQTKASRGRRKDVLWEAL